MDAIQSKLTYILFYNVFTIKNIVSKVISKMQLSESIKIKTSRLSYILFYNKYI